MKSMTTVCQGWLWSAMVAASCLWVAPHTLALTMMPEDAQVFRTSSRMIDLSGRWAFRFDPQDSGLAENWQDADHEARWTRIDVPGSFNVERPGRKWYRGAAWYARALELPEPFPNDSRVVLHFLGAAIRTRVWVNGQPAGENLYPYIPFQFDVTELIEPGEKNQLVVMTDNRILEKAIPDTEWDGWWFYGGLTREVLLEIRPPVAVDNLWFDTRMAPGHESGAGQVEWAAEAAAVIDNRATTRTVGILRELRDPAGRTVWTHREQVEAPPGRSRHVAGASFIDVAAWTPDSPSLYDYVVTLETPTGHWRGIRTGFRELRVSGTRLLLNGEPLQVRGTSRHEDFLGHGSTVPAERTLADLREIKDLGCNLLRMAHYTQHPYVHELCDELGLLAWAEIPAWKTSNASLGDPETYRVYALGQIEAMIDHYRRHPSIGIWSIGNEFESQTATAAAYVERAARDTRRLDPTRLVTFASDQREEDASLAHVDFIAVNEYYGWYYGTIHDIGGVLDQLHAMHPDKPIVVSEFGAGAPPGARTSRPYRIHGRDYSEDYQVKMMLAHLEQIYHEPRRDYVAGGLFWLYNDFDDPHRVGNNHPEAWAYVNLKGVVTRERYRKPSYYMVRDFFRALMQE